MVNWIFSSKTTLDEFKQRITEKKWPIFKFTRYKSQLKKSDNVIFYQAGKDGQKFIGLASISSEIITNNMDYYVTLQDIQIWKKPIEVSVVLNELQFIINKSNWGIYFQGGVTKLPDVDYKLITSKSKEILKKK